MNAHLLNKEIQILKTKLIGIEEDGKQWDEDCFELMPKAGRKWQFREKKSGPYLDYKWFAHGKQRHWTILNLPESVETMFTSTKDEKCN